MATLGIRKGDEIIIPDLTFIATANAVRYCDAKPVFVDSHPEYWCLDPEKIEESITKNTRAIIPVHLYGHPCDMDPILEIAQDHNLFIIEDAAEAHGAEYHGKKVGSFGDISCFSFYGNKIITTGEGGMCLTDNEEFAEKAKLLRDHAMSKEIRYWHEIVGYNYRITNLQAAVGVAQLEKIEKIIDKKRKNAKLYSNGLRELAEHGYICLHPEMEWAKSVFWMYSILIEDVYGINRDEFMIKLRANDIDSRPFFYPINAQPPYYEIKGFPKTEDISRRGINLPSAVNLTEDSIQKIIDTIITMRK